MSRKDLMAHINELHEQEWARFDNLLEQTKECEEKLDVYSELIEVLKGPEVVFCKDCKHWDSSDKTCMHTLEGQYAEPVFFCKAGEHNL